MKFNIEELYNKSKDNKNILTKYIFILSFMLFIVSILTFFPVNNLNFILDVLGYLFRLGSILIFIFVVVNCFKLIRYQLFNEKNSLLYVSIIILFLSYLFYIICFNINLLSLFI